MWQNRTKVGLKHVFRRQRVQPVVSFWQNRTKVGLKHYMRHSTSPAGNAAAAKSNQGGIETLPVKPVVDALGGHWQNRTKVGLKPRPFRTPSCPLPEPVGKIEPRWD
jgi:hypothetical protein